MSKSTDIKPKANFVKSPNIASQLSASKKKHIVLGDDCVSW